MPEKKLDSAKIGAGFEQVRGEGVPQTVRVRRFRKAGMQPRMSACVHYLGSAQGLIKLPAGKQKVAWVDTPPVGAQQFEQFGCWLRRLYADA